MNAAESATQIPLTRRSASRVTRGVSLAIAILCGGVVFAVDGAPRAQPGASSISSPVTTAGQSATQLPDGRWLLLGGEGEHSGRVYVARPNRGSTSVSATLQHPRSAHTATLLPDGRIFVLGGLDAAGSPVTQAETFDLATRVFRPEPAAALISRAHHSATVVSDGRVLITGGVDARGQPVDHIELWNPADGDVEPIEARPRIAGRERTTALLPTGSVLLWAGLATDGLSAEPAELFDPETEQLRSVTTAEAQALVQSLDGPQAPAIQATSPAAEASGVPGDEPLVIRFNKRMAVTSLNNQSITLVGPAGAEPIRVVPVEQGMLAFIRSSKELLPASRYTLFISGATDNAQRSLPLTTIGFDTSPKSATSNARTVAAAGGQAAAQPGPQDVDLAAQRSRLTGVEQRALSDAQQVNDSEDWIPGREHFTGRWLADRATSPLEELPPRQATLGVTALSGQVLGMNGVALPGVTLRIADREIRTDVTGRFLLQGLRPGFAKMEIDGASADRPGSRYGYYAARIYLKPLLTTVVPYTIWMPRLDPAGTVTIAAPTTSETVITSPRIPGLELHIPAGTVIRDRQGRIVTELNMTAIPVDRPPFPVPNLDVPVYFTIQPGGAVLESVTGKPGPGARLFYPNFKNEVPGALGSFWNYDAEEREWFVYGLGTISADGKQAIPDEGVVIHEFTGAMFNGSETPSPKGDPPCNDKDECSTGDKVSELTGQFNHTEHDMVVNDVIPIDLARTYDSADKNQRAFGVGMTHGYDIFLFSQNQFQEVDVILPNGTRVHYVRTTPGNGTIDAVFETQAPGAWRHSVIRSSPGRIGWDLTFHDGSNWYFHQTEKLSEITDSHGNLTRIVRERDDGESGKALRIVSPNGRTVEFIYLNNSTIISDVKDNLGRTVHYNYDAQGRLVEVIDSAGGSHEYVWDTTKNRITEIHDANGDLVVQNEYDDTSGRVTSQTLADGSAVTYDYADQDGVTTHTDITDPRGSVRRVLFDDQGYVVQSVFPLGSPDAQVNHYQVANGRITAHIDALNRRTEYQYDDTDNITHMTRLAGTNQAIDVTIAYEPVFNQPITMTDPNGNITNLTYDNKGNLIRIVDPLGNITTFEYDSQGRRRTTTDPLGRVSTLTFEGPDLSAVTDPLGRRAQFLNDAAGRVIAVVDPLGNRTVFDWDDLDRLIKLTDPRGAVATSTYDGNGNLLSNTDRTGNTTTYGYDILGRLQSIRDARSREETRSYEPGGLVTQLVDRKGQVDAITYDALGRTKTIGFGGTELHPTAFKSLVENTWDAGNRLIQIVDKTCADPINNHNCSSVASVSAITRTYDDLDRMIREVTPQGEVNYTYDNAGRRTSMTIKNGATGAQVAQPTITYTYDNANRLTGIHQAAGSINGGEEQHIALNYDSAGRRTKTTLPNGSTIEHEYDDGDQLTALIYKKADGSLIGDLRYEYDTIGRRTAMGGSLARLNVPAADVTDASYDANHRLQTWDGNTYTYDDDGNLTSDGANTYLWDERGRLRTISSGGSELASFQYDSQGRRTAKTIGSETTGYLYDEVNIVQELQGASNAAPVKSHLLTGGIDQTFLRIEGNTGENRYSVLADANNNTVMLLNTAQDKVVGYTYEP